MSYTGWLLFLSSLPTKPVGNRVKVWRKLVKSGAVQIKGSAYVLPLNEEHVEFFQWLVQEITGMGGEAAFARVERIDTVPDTEIVALFHRRKESDYQHIAKALDVAERRIESLRPGGTIPGVRRLASQLTKIRKDFDEARRTDFFTVASGLAIETRLAQDFSALQALKGIEQGSATNTGIARRSVEAYRGKRWMTRKSPFVDRMASAWLIRKFIDPGAVFEFIEEAEAPATGNDTVVFDVTGSEFTHVGDLCTFEVLVRSFEIKDTALTKVAEIVHDLDIKDDRYHSIEAAGVEEILAGILRIAGDDADALDRGMAVFEMLYAAKSR
jgi:hypothetical protein